MSNPRWITEVYGQDLNKAYPNAVQVVGGVAVLQKSFVNQFFNPTSDSGETVITVTGTYQVQPTDALIITNLTAPGTVTLQLPGVAQRGGLILGIADLAGNANIILTPNPGPPQEFVMGLTSGQLISNGQGLGTGASVYLRPVTSILGWVNI